ncbi:MAG: STAS domain-containing protein [SAR324 cluster bacterium]|nr:STAS domain-containing protein [SAR324 cluster bacterium]
MGLAHRVEDDVGIIAIQGDFDTKSTRVLQQYIRTLLDSEQLKAIVLNLKRVERLDSSGIGMLMEQHKLLEKNNSLLLLSNCHPAYLEILQMMQWDQVLHLFQTEEDALASLSIP